MRLVGRVGVVGGGATAEHVVLVWNINTAAVAAGDSVGVDGWAEGFAALIDRIAPRFTRYEPVRHAAALIAGLVSGVARKNCWTIEVCLS